MSVSESAGSPLVGNLRDTFNDHEDSRSVNLNLPDAEKACNIHEDSQAPKDMVMADSTCDGMALSIINKSCVPDSRTDLDIADTTTNDLPPDFLPTWLAQTIGYLRQVSANQTWQDLVTEFVQFEKSGPPIGVMFDRHLCSLSHSD